MGETALDEATYNDYLEEMRAHYTADKVYIVALNFWIVKTDLMQYHLLGITA